MRHGRGEPRRTDSTAVILTGAQPTLRRRQVIIATHNTNLVINTDADQIILAEVGTASAGGLPPIRYKSGGLDEGANRTLVCNILEGGELAFRDRARRLRIGLKR